MPAPKKHLQFIGPLSLRSSSYANHTIENRDLIQVSTCTLSLDLTLHMTHHYNISINFGGDVSLYPIKLKCRDYIFI